jgi:enoyl-CoA hydratase
MLIFASVKFDTEYYFEFVWVYRFRIGCGVAIEDHHNACARRMALELMTLDVTPTEQGVALITLRRPEALNALNTQMLGEIATFLAAASVDDSIRGVVVTGSRRAFAAGADIKEMADRDLVGILDDPRVAHWQAITSFSKPIIAAVNGFAFGAGFELAMCADILIAGEDALFGQPEINLGIIPGAGGTQRLLRAVGKSKAMQMVLSGEAISARDALQFSLASEVTQPELTVERAVELARLVATKAPLAVRLAKETLLKAFDTDLATGLRFERLAFTVLAGTKDRNEGIRAFQEKRKAHFVGR